MGRFLNGVVGLGVGFVIFVALIPFGVLGAIGAGLGVENAGWIMLPLALAFILMIGSPLYFWIIAPFKDVFRKLVRKVVDTVKS